MHENEVIQCWLYFNCGIGIWEKLLIWFMLWTNNRFCRNVQYKLRFCLCCNITAKLRVKIAAFSFSFLTSTWLMSSSISTSANFAEVLVPTSTTFALEDQHFSAEASYFTLLFICLETAANLQSYISHKSNVHRCIYFMEQYRSSSSNKISICQPQLSLIYNYWSACCIHRKMNGTNGEGQYISSKVNLL